jgi:hypothetical protein
MPDKYNILCKVHYDRNLVLNTSPPPTASAFLVRLLEPPSITSLPISDIYYGHIVTPVQTDQGKKRLVVHPCIDKL